MNFIQKIKTGQKNFAPFTLKNSELAISTTVQYPI